MKIKISSDHMRSVAELIEKYGIRIVLTIIIDGKGRKDGIDIREGYFDWVDSGGEMCKTARHPRRNMRDFPCHLRDHDAVIHINIGSGFLLLQKRLAMSSVKTSMLSTRRTSQDRAILCWAARLCEKASPLEIIDG